MIARTASPRAPFAAVHGPCTVFSQCIHHSSRSLATGQRRGDSADQTDGASDNTETHRHQHRRRHSCPTCRLRACQRAVTAFPSPSKDDSRSLLKPPRPGDDLRVEQECKDVRAWHVLGHAGSGGHSRDRRLCTHIRRDGTLMSVCAAS